jgi:hypothetical protein
VGAEGQVQASAAREPPTFRSSRLLDAFDVLARRSRYGLSQLGIEVHGVCECSRRVSKATAVEREGVEDDAATPAEVQ